MDNNTNKGIEEGLTITIGDLFKSNIITHDAYVHVVIDEDIIDKYITAHDLYSGGDRFILTKEDCSVIFRSKITKLTSSIMDGKPFIHIEGSLMTCDVSTLLLYELINLKDKKNDKMVVHITDKNGRTESYLFGIGNISDEYTTDTKYLLISQLLIATLGHEICTTEYESMMCSYTEDHVKEVIISL